MKAWWVEIKVGKGLRKIKMGEDLGGVGSNAGGRTNETRRSEGTIAGSLQ